MRVIVTGSRDWPDDGAIANALLQLLADVPIGSGLTVVHGDCPQGADFQADRWCEWARSPLAQPLGEQVTVERHPADWPRCGPLCRAGIPVDLTEMP